MVTARATWPHVRWQRGVFFYERTGPHRIFSFRWHRWWFQLEWARFDS